MAATTDLALQDELTGAYNRRFLSLLFGQRWRELMDLHGRISLIIVDLDEFKAVNDSHGHLTGDDVLRATADILRAHFRQSDLIIRYGGDEFIVIVPEAGEAEAAQLAERARTAGAAHPLRSRKNGRPLECAVAFSIGVATCPEDGQTGEELIAAADRRLYEDKATRRRPAPRATSPVFVAAATTLGLALLLTTIGRLGDRETKTLATPTTTPQVSATVEPDREAEMLRAQLAELQSKYSAILHEQAAAEQAAKRLSDQRLEAEQRPPVEPGRAAPTPTPTPDRRAAELRQTVEELQERLRAREAARLVNTDAVNAVTTPTPPVASPEQTPTTAPAEAAIVTPPVLLNQVTPTYPQMGKAMRKAATVRIRAVVDTRGRVIDAQPIGDSVGFGFEEAARQAARRSKFQSGTRNGVPVQMEYILVYVFERQ